MGWWKKKKQYTPEGTVYRYTVYTVYTIICISQSRTEVYLECLGTPLIHTCWRFAWSCRVTIPVRLPRPETSCASCQAWPSRLWLLRRWALSSGRRIGDHRTAAPHCAPKRRKKMSGEKREKKKKRWRSDKIGQFVYYLRWRVCSSDYLFYSLFYCEIAEYTIVHTVHA